MKGREAMVNEGEINLGEQNAPTQLLYGFAWAV